MEPNFATPWKGGGIGQAREDCFLPRHLWGAETYDWHIPWGCARNLACPRLPSLAPPELKPLSSLLCPKQLSIQQTWDLEGARYFFQICQLKQRFEEFCLAPARDPVVFWTHTDVWSDRDEGSRRRSCSPMVCSVSRIGRMGSWRKAPQKLNKNQKLARKAQFCLGFSGIIR
jgi:hypothetical protein